MRRVLPVILALLFLLSLHDGVLAQDAGVPDTLYIEVYQGDQFVYDPGPWFVRFPIYVTNDVVDPVTDSIAGFLVPLCYEVSSPGTVNYCSLGVWWNGFSLLDVPGGEVQQNRSIFRHLPSMQDVQIHNQMLDLNSNFINGWDFIVLDLGDQVSHFWFTAVPTGADDQRWPPGSRSLLATMTFRTSFSDSIQLCIDTCFWPPASRFAFANSNMETYIPQNFVPVCQQIQHASPPWFWLCPGHEYRDSSGHYATGEFAVYAYGMPYWDDVVLCDAEYVGQGVENVTVHYDDWYWPPNEEVKGHVEYDVVDHCQSGGYIKIDAQDRQGEWTDGSCIVPITSNSPPILSPPDTTRAIAGSVRGMIVSATDPGNDSVQIEFDGMWFEPDSLRSPTNPPSFDGGNPGLFSWVSTEAEAGAWICSFSAADICGAAGSSRTTILVGPLFCGDSAPDEIINVADVIYLLNYLYAGGPAPNPICKGDANCDGITNVADAIMLLNYLFRLGSAPCFGCCPE